MRAAQAGATVTWRGRPAPRDAAGPASELLPGLRYRIAAPILPATTRGGSGEPKHHGDGAPPVPQPSRSRYRHPRGARPALPTAAPAGDDPPSRLPHGRRRHPSRAVRRRFRPRRGARGAAHDPRGRRPHRAAGAAHRVPFTQPDLVRRPGGGASSPGRDCRAGARERGTPRGAAARAGRKARSGDRPHHRRDPAGRPRAGDHVPARR